MLKVFNNILQTIDNTCANKSLVELISGIDFIKNNLVPVATIEKDMLLFIVDRMESYIPVFDKETGEIL